MGIIISCFVNQDKRVFIAPTMDKNQCLEYKYDLESRKMFNTNLVAPLARGSLLPSWMTHVWMYDGVAVDFFDQLVGTPEKLIEFVKKGGLDKASLTALIDPKCRKIFLNGCVVIEKGATIDCATRKDPCLADGCAFEGTDEVCLNAVLLSEGKCLKDCINFWVAMFEYPENRIEVWRK